MNVTSRRMAVYRGLLTPAFVLLDRALFLISRGGF
jgi:hypothetical protein